VARQVLDELARPAGTPARDPVDSLTGRELEVLQLLAEGRSMKEIAYMLNIAPRTVAFHKYTMMEHLQIRSSAELIEYAMRSSIVAA
jgi:DNA-binding NarL/FixJ family response regulator